MNLPSVLLNNPHLPIKLGMDLSQVVDLCSTFYEVDFNLEDLKPTQVFMSPSGSVKVDLILNTEEEPIVTFVNTIPPKLNQDVPSDLVEDWDLDNPMSLSPTRASLLGEPLTLVSVSEIAFLEDMQLNKPLSVMNPEGDRAYKLSSLLNDYGYLGRWVSGTFGDYSTAGFELIYLGPSSHAPSEFYLEESEKLAIIRIHSGFKVGYLCLRT